MSGDRIGRNNTDEMHQQFWYRYKGDLLKLQQEKQDKWVRQLALDPSIDRLKSKMLRMHFGASSPHYNPTVLSRISLWEKAEQVYNG